MTVTTLPKEPPQPKVVSNDESTVVIRPGTGNLPEEGERISIPTEVAILPVRNMVIFPGTVVPLAIGREKSKRLLNAVLPSQKIIVAVCQKNPEAENPGPEDLYPVGTAVMVLKLLKVDEGNQSIIVHGLVRVKIEEWMTSEPYLQARISVPPEKSAKTTEGEALLVNARNLARRVMQLSPNIPEEAVLVLNNIEQPGAMADFLASNLQMDIPAKQRILEEFDINVRLRKLGSELQRQVEILELSDKIQSQVRSNIDKSQREYFLQEQLKAIQKELGQMDEKSAEVEQLREKIDKAGMPPKVQEEALRELSRMEKIPTVSPEYSVIRTYIDWMIELPWSVGSEDKLDVNVAARVLDEDHYDLEKVKRRILEYLAVRKLAPETHGPILCFVGPPGVGKTSLGQSIARAMGRKFIRMSLGGMRDEAELRGHRRTYIGAMPGRIVQEIRKAGTNNPVFMLDELDKVGADWRGDPTSALLEVLDPAQNNTFQDHYLSVPFDLSHVLFIGTANIMGTVPPALRDRLEVIEIPGYTEREKLHIAMKYLVPRQLKENGLRNGQARWTERALLATIRSYTREAGVRELERQIGTVCRGIAAQVAGGRAASRQVTPPLVAKILGPRKYESELALRTSTAGVATGLAYTPAGGEIIFVESAAFPGKGSLTLTGQIGDVMKESAQAAYSLLRSRAKNLDIPAEQFGRVDIHVHVPAGAIPKDGPSAGVAMFTSLASLLTNRPVRADVAMTGEITLRGLVLPVGGIKEKVLAAKSAGIKAVVLPERNLKDLLDIPADARQGMEFKFVRGVEDVVKAVFLDAKPRKRPATKPKRRRTKGK